MPKSKKTRAKKYHPKTVKVGPYWPAEAQADVEAKLTQVALYVESSLPAGTLTDQQMDWIEDTLNWFLGLLYKRYEHLNQQEINEVGPIAMAARKAINDISDRQLKGQTKGFVATGGRNQSHQPSLCHHHPDTKRGRRTGASQNT